MVVCCCTHLSERPSVSLLLRKVPPTVSSRFNLYTPSSSKHNTTRPLSLRVVLSSSELSDTELDALQSGINVKNSQKGLTHLISAFSMLARQLRILRSELYLRLKLMLLAFPPRLSSFIPAVIQKHEM